MTFYEYMMEYHSGSDLANDMKNDPDFPRQEKNKRIIRDYLKSRNAVNECLDAFEKCWFDFKKREAGRFDN